MLLNDINNLKNINKIMREKVITKTK